MAIIGAILGDISGSQYEFDRPKDFDWINCELFTEKCTFTDDTVMSLAVKMAIDTGRDYAECMRALGKEYPYCGFGGMFYNWVLDDNSKPYGSYGNGSAMRVSYVADAFTDLSDVQREAEKTALVSHNHLEGIKGAVVTATCIWMAKNGKSKQEIYDYVLSEYPVEAYPWSIAKSLEEIRDDYKWNETCQGSVPVAMRCFYESDSYISFLRNVFSLPCDTDTLAAIGGGVAEEFYGKTGLKNEKIMEHYLDQRLSGILGSGWY